MSIKEKKLGNNNNLKAKKRMSYNPIFEEEVERNQELRSLKDAITYRATRDQAVDFSSKLIKFCKEHPMITLLVTGLVGFSLNRK